MKRRVLSFLVTLLVLCSALPHPIMANTVPDYTDLLLDADMTLIAAVGHQESGSLACSCFALAYARTITDDTVHSFSEYNVYGDDQYNVSAAWSLGDYARVQYSTTTDAFSAICNHLESGRPVLASVTGRGAAQHFITVVGFENVESYDTLTEENFLILDTIHTAPFAVENMGEVGYELKYDAAYLLVEPLPNVPQADIAESVPFDGRYVTECDAYPSSVVLAMTENYLPKSLPCDADTADIYDCAWEEKEDHPLYAWDRIEANILYKNTKGQYWYGIVLADGTRAYVPAECCEAVEFIPPQLIGGSFPEQITGATYLEGTISTNAVIDTVQAQVFRGEAVGVDPVIESDAVPVGKSIYSLKYSMVDYTLPFQDLKNTGNGYYCLSYEVTHTGYYVNSGELVEATETDMVGSYVFYYGTPTTETVTLTFDPNGGSCSVESQTAVKGAEIGTLPVAERNGFTFEGWFTQREGGEQVLAHSVYWTDVTLYAHWESEYHRHSLTPVVTAPTCLKKGFTLYSCECGYSFKIDETDALGHFYQNGSCVRCDTKDPATSPEEGADVIFTLSDAAGFAGQTVRVSLTAYSTVEVNSIAVYRLSYDENALEFAGFDDYEAVEDRAFLFSIDSEQGIITVGLQDAEKLDGKICDLVFKVRSTVKNDGEYTVSATAVAKMDSDMVKSLVKEATVSVSARLLGDIDGDGNVNLKDALRLFQHSMDSESYPIDYTGNIDYDGDGNVNLKDSLRLFQYSMNPESYPIS